jgi:hypothetical protein
VSRRLGSGMYFFLSFILLLMYICIYRFIYNYATLRHEGLGLCTSMAALAGMYFFPSFILLLMYICVNRFI